MYIPPAFAENRPEELLAIMRAASLPILITPTAAGLAITHLPLLVAGPDRIIGHVAKANPQWREALPGAESVAIFTAVDGYVSPNWYATKAETHKVVPTWNYQAVHATGTLEIIEDTQELLAIVTALVNHHEAGRPAPWAVADAQPAYIATQLKGIIGIVLHVTKLEGAAKLSQNKTLPDRHGVIKGTATENPALSEAIKRTL